MPEAVQIKPPDAPAQKPLVGSLYVMAQLLHGVGLNCDGLEVCFPPQLWDIAREELNIEAPLRAADVPLTVRFPLPGTLAPVAITLRKVTAPSGLLVAP